MAFHLTNYRNNQIIHYNYYSTLFYKNEYDKTLEKGGYIKINYSSHPNKYNILNNYLTKNLYIVKSKHKIENNDSDGELIVEHISSTNHKTFYSCFLLKTSSQVHKNEIDNIIKANSDSVLELNKFIEPDQDAILYSPDENTDVLIFTKPILVNSLLDKLGDSDLFLSYNPTYSVVKVKSVLGGTKNIEGFVEGLDKNVTAAAYCQPIDELDPNIDEKAAIIIPADGKVAANDATNTSLKTLLNFFAFFIMILFSVVIVPILYNIFILDLVLDNYDLTDPQAKLNRLSGADVFMSIVITGFAFSFINYGISNSIPVYTTIGFYILLFFISAFLYFQYNRTMNNDFIQQFLGKFGSSPVPASFDKMKSDVFGLFVDNMKLMFLGLQTEEKIEGNLIKNVIIPDNYGKPKTELAISSAVVLLFVIYSILYLLYFKCIGTSKNSSVSFLLSIPFYLFLISFYISIYIKHSRNKKIMKDSGIGE